MRARCKHTGASTLALTTLLSLVLLLVLGFSHGHQMLALHSATRQSQSAVALEAAEAGLEWAVSQLNNPTLLDAQCRPAQGPGAMRYRERLWTVPTRDTPRQLHGRAAHCHHLAQENTWRCTCPNASEPAPTTDLPATTTGPAFAVQVLPGERADLLTVIATGCSDGPRPCARARGADTAASVRLQLTLGQLPALATLPDAALTAGGTVSWHGAVNIQRHDPQGSGLALRTGGAVQAPALELLGPAGSPVSQALITDDAELAGPAAPALFVKLFRLDPDSWRGQPLVQRVACAQACDQHLLAHLSGHAQPTPIWLPEGLRLDRAITLGSPTQPVLMVIDGPVHLGAAAHIFGLVYVRSTQWHDRGGAKVSGAVIFESDVQGQGPARFEYHPEALRQLMTQSGTIAPVAGSWRDFD